MSFLGEVIGEFFGKVIINGIGWLFSHIGTTTKWLFHVGKKPYQTIQKEGKNGLIGFFVFAIIIFLVIMWFKYSGK